MRLMGQNRQVMGSSKRILLHVADGERRPVHPSEIFFLEAEGETTKVRLRSNRRLFDPRSLGELEELLEPLGFLRIHRNHMVNLARIRTIRRREGGQDREVKLDPPANRVLPVSRGRLAELWESFAGP